MFQRATQRDQVVPNPLQLPYGPPERPQRGVPLRAPVRAVPARGVPHDKNVHFILQSNIDIIDCVIKII